jgi:hypothetical protein
MVLSSSDRKRASRLRQAEKREAERLRKLSQRSQSRSDRGGADEELARSFSGTASVERRSEPVESETVGNTKVRLLVV